ncbi:MAG: hypothetical protein K2N78_09020 [Oscillospiraceae bacterium]|nr:hypothetical protein [Oscillospiraceae bacterium]
MRKRYIGVVLAALLAAAAMFAWSGVAKSLKPARQAAQTDDSGEAGGLYALEDLATAGKADAVPTEEQVQAARESALEGMTTEQVQRLKDVVTAANLWWEGQYFSNNIFDRLADPQNLYWNYFDQTGEIQIGWAWDGEVDKAAVCEEEGLTEDEFYAQYGSRVMAENGYDADGFTAVIDELRETVQNEDLRSDLQYIIDEIQLAKRTHVMEHANNMYKALHDLDYFLLRYGPSMDEGTDTWIRDKSTVSIYYAMLSVYN